MTHLSNRSRLWSTGRRKATARCRPTKDHLRRPDPEAEDMLAFFQAIRSAKHRRQLLELARSFVEAGSPRNSETR